MPEKVSEEVKENALILIACVRAAMINRCKHYNKKGELLPTAVEVLRCLIDEGRVTVDENSRVEKAKVENILEQVKKEYATWT